MKTCPCKTASWMFKAALFVIAPNWKQLKCPSAGECINKLWYDHTVECYWGIKKNEIVMHATAWVHLKNISKKIGHKRQYMIPFI